MSFPLIRGLSSPLVLGLLKVAGQLPPILTRNPDGSYTLAEDAPVPTRQIIDLADGTYTVVTPVIPLRDKVRALVGDRPWWHDGEWMQDAITPANVGDPVGIIPDANPTEDYGPELWDDSNPRLVGDAANLGGGRYHINSTGAFSAVVVDSVTLDISKTYKFELEVESNDAGDIRIQDVNKTFTSAGVYTDSFTPTGTGLFIKRFAGATDVIFKNVSIREEINRDLRTSNETNRPVLTAQYNGVGPLGPEMFSDLVAPTVDNALGSAGMYDAANREFTNSGAGGNSGYPRFNFDLGLEDDTLYYVVGQFSGDITSFLIRFANSGTNNSIRHDSINGRLEGCIDVQDGFASVQFLTNGPDLTSLVIDSLSIRKIPAESQVFLPSFNGVNHRNLAAIPAGTLSNSERVFIVYRGDDQQGVLLNSEDGTQGNYLGAWNASSSNTLSSGAGNPDVFVNGQQVTTQDALRAAIEDNATHIIEFADADMAAWTGVSMGGFDGWFASGLIAPPLFFPEAIGAANRDDIIAYLQQRYGQ